MGFRRSVRVFRILGGKTCQPTRRLRVLEVENRHRPSPASGRTVLGPDRTVFSGGSGIGFLWTALIQGKGGEGDNCTLTHPKNSLVASVLSSYLLNMVKKQNKILPFSRNRP